MQKNLTPWEQETFTLLAAGKTPNDIAAALNISHNAVLNYQKSLYRKLEVNSAYELHKSYPAAPPGNISQISPFSFPFIITLYDDESLGGKYEISPNILFYNDEWLSSPFKLGKGKITEGEIYTVNLVFTSNVDFSYLAMNFIDQTFKKDGTWMELSKYKKKSFIKAHEENRILCNFEIFKSASSALRDANLFVMNTSIKTIIKPTLTFTHLSIKKTMEIKTSGTAV